MAKKYRARLSGPTSLHLYIIVIYGRSVAQSDPLENCSGFDWDEFNALKNRQQHHVTPEEAEDAFFHEPLVVGVDVRHSKTEKRYYALGQTATGRLLFLAFTVRGKLIRVISVREMNRKRK